MTSPSQREVFGRTLVELAAEDERVVVLDGDLANSTRADIFADAYPDRFLAMGIAEQNMAGVAAGLATLGFVPWVSTFAAFAVKRDLDQVRVVIAQPGLNVKICGAYSGLLTGFTGKTHQSVEDIAVMRAMPNMVVLAPADAHEARAAIVAATAHDGPVYMRVGRDASPDVFDEACRFEIGRAELFRGLGHCFADYVARGLRWAVDYDCRRPRLIQVTFNAGSTVLAIGASYAVYHAHAFQNLRIESAFQLAFAAIAFFVTNTGSIAVVIAMTENKSARRSIVNPRSCSGEM